MHLMPCKLKLVKIKERTDIAINVGSLDPSGGLIKGEADILYQVR